MSLTPLPPPPPFREKYIFFALPSMNVPLPAELKFGENPAQRFVTSSDLYHHRKRWMTRFQWFYHLKTKSQQIL